MYRVKAGASYLRLTNADNKVWIVPREDMRTALNIYQPSGVKGRVLKYLLPLTFWIPKVNNLIKARNVSVEMDISLRRLICRVLNIDNFTFSIFEGTPSVHKKVTIQIFQGSKILAYCKVSSQRDIIELFREEQSKLEYLSSQGVEGIPICYYCGTIDDNSESVAYIISTTKTLRSQTPHLWSRVHWNFIEALHEKTKHRIEFKESDLAKSLIILEGYLPTLPTKSVGVLLKAIKEVRGNYDNQEVEFSAHHGDFTPWNMFVTRGELFVFDWEYSSLSFPPCLDWFHFFTQTAKFERGLSAEQIVKLYFRSKEQHPDLSILSYKTYLLTIVSRCIDREKGKVSRDSDKKIALWLDILRRL
ncbi:MAG: hypothetical protein SNJ29_09435 [Rikenellaceae bacterium]